MRLRVFAVAMLACCLSGCAPATMSTYAPAPPAIVAGTPIALSATQASKVKDGVTRVLKDPGSAVFGEMSAARHPDGKISVCGYVNARNSYGGYTGQQPFLGGLTPNEFIVVDIAGTDIEWQALLQTCRRLGVAV